MTAEGRKYEAASADVLRCFAGDGAVEVLRSDPGALLLECADGEPLAAQVREGNDEAAAHILCDVVICLHRYAGPIPNGVFGLKQQFQSLFRRASRRGEDAIFRRAARVAGELLATEVNPRLLHGDIHHGNILRSSQRGWLAIDPQGVVGEPAYEVANAFFNPDDGLQTTPKRIESLIRVFSERLNFGPRRVLQFAFAYGCLSSSWQMDDGENPDRRLMISARLESLLKD